MSGFGQKVRNELQELIPVTVFFFCAFELLAITESLILRQYGIRIETFFNAAIGALVVAKVVIIVDHFPLVNRFPSRPLVYNVVWKTAIYFVASLLVRYVEHLIHFWRESATFGEANQRLLTQVIWPHFWGVQLWLLVLLLVYCSFRELVRALGRERIIRMFFHEPPKSGHDREHDR
jgi:hypothetical protein